MSRRFGRNQRRRAREAVAAVEQRNANLEAAHHMDRALLRDQSETIRSLREEIAEAKQIAGEHSLLFRSKPLRFEALPGDHLDVDLDVLAPPLLSVSNLMDSEEFYRFTRTPLDVLLTRVSEDALRNQVHLTVLYRDGAVGYGVPRGTFARIGNNGVARLVAREIVPRMIRQLIAVIRKEDAR